MKRRVISLLLAIVMVLGLLPAMGTAAFAADVEAWEEDLPEMWLSIIDTRNNRNITERGVALRPGEELTLQVEAQYFDERQVTVPNPQWVTDNPRWLLFPVLGSIPLCPVLQSCLSAIPTPTDSLLLPSSM